MERRDGKGKERVPPPPDESSGSSEDAPPPAPARLCMFATGRTPSQPGPPAPGRGNEGDLPLDEGDTTQALVVATAPELGDAPRGAVRPARPATTQAKPSGASIYLDTTSTSSASPPGPPHPRMGPSSADRHGHDRERTRGSGHSTHSPARRHAPRDQGFGGGPRASPVPLIGKR